MLYCYFPNSPISCWSNHGSDFFTFVMTSPRLSNEICCFLRHLSYHVIKLDSEVINILTGNQWEMWVAPLWTAWQCRTQRLVASRQCFVQRVVVDLLVLLFQRMFGLSMWDCVKLEWRRSVKLPEFVFLSLQDLQVPFQRFYSSLECGNLCSI